MGAVIEAIAHIIDWRFGVGLAVGIALTLRYVVIGIYHPIIKGMEGADDARTDDNP